MANSSSNPAGAGADKERWDALGVHTYVKDKGTGETADAWTRVGRAFPNSNGGFTLKLRAVPAAQDGEVTIVVKKHDPKDRTAADDYDLP